MVRGASCGGSACVQDLFLVREGRAGSDYVNVDRRRIDGGRL